METYLSKAIEMGIAFAPKLVMAIVTLIVGFWIANKLASILSKVLRKRGVDETVTPFLASLVSAVVKVLVLISVAGMFGIETTSFIALLGVAGLAIGMALQGSLSHFASGVLLLVFKPYKVGDLVSLAGGSTGHVEEIQIFNTVLRTLDNKKIIIPNGAVTSATMTNISGQGEIRVDMLYSVAGEEDLDKVRKVVQAVADSCPLILKNPGTDILVNCQEIGITKFDVRPWCKSEHYWDVYYFMQENIKRAFTIHGIKGPTPAMQVMMKN